MEALSNEKRTKSDKKATRKLNRLVAQATKQMEIEVSEAPTRFIMIGNAGLMTGLTTDGILGAFLPYGSIRDVIMVPCKSFCFVKFGNACNAADAMLGVHGKKLPHIDKPVYLTYVSKVPSTAGFAASDYRPPGLIIIKEVVTEEQEELLLNVQFDGPGNMKNRSVKHYGYEFLYETNKVDCDHPMCEPIPPLCQNILSGILALGYISHMPDQLTINRYKPGQGIPLHVDTHSTFEDEILSISLGSPLVMEFKHPDGRQHGVLLPRRSLTIMKQDSRYLWSHGITARRTDIVQDKTKENGLNVLYRGTRTSYTFRKVRRAPCQCCFPDQCDSQRGFSPPSKFAVTTKLPESDVEAKHLECTHVHQVYEEIATHFSDTRHSPWPHVLAFIQSLPSGTLLLDLGCGNGKYLGINPLAFKVGCDRSTKLMSICGQRTFQGFCCDAMDLPLRSEVFDVCICIAVIHHLATVDRRVHAVQEMARVLKPGGQALIYVWALEQKVDAKPSNYLNSSPKSQAILPSIGASNTDSAQAESALPVHTNRTQFAHQDMFVPWHLKSRNRNAKEPGPGSVATVLHRYYHVFQKGELETLCAAVGDFSLKESYHDNGNWCVVLEKKKRN